MIDRSHDLPLVETGEGARDKPRQRLFSAPAGFGGRSRHHAAHGRAASGLSVRWQPDAPRLLALEGIKTGRLHVATLMKRMAIEAIYRKPNNIEADARAQDLSVSPAQSACDEARSGLGNGYYVRSYGARLCLSRCSDRLVQPPGSQPSERVNDFETAGV